MRGGPENSQFSPEFAEKGKITNTSNNNSNRETLNELFPGYFIPPIYTPI